jgi:hypothetical protein
MCMEQWRNDTNSVRPNQSQETLSQCQLFHHDITYMNNVKTDLPERILSYFYENNWRAFPLNWDV